MDKKDKINNQSNEIHLEKCVDQNGVSIINVDHFDTNNEYLKSSRYGSTPYAHKDSNFNEKINQIRVVKRYDETNANKAQTNAMKYSNQLAQQASDDYMNDIDYTNLIKKKSLVTAKIKMWRLLNKSLIIQKQYLDEQKENHAHENCLDYINKNFDALLIKNDAKLTKSLNDLQTKQLNQLDKLNQKYQTSLDKLNNQYHLDLNINDNFENLDNINQTLQAKLNEIKTDYLNQQKQMIDKFTYAAECFKNNHFINKESIIEVKLASLNKQEQNHLQNLAAYKANLDKFRKLNYQLQNKELKTLIKQINHFNKHHHKQIDSTYLPTLISHRSLNQTKVELNLSYENNQTFLSGQIEKQQIKVKTLNNQPVQQANKIYVLIKFKDVNSPFKQSVMLEELSKQTYQDQLNYINLNETKELYLAKTILQSKLDEVDRVRQEIKFIKKQSIVLKHNCQAISEFQNEAIIDKQQNWNVTDYENKLNNRQIENNSSLDDRINKLENQ